jgi:hypothetical protein
MMLVPFNSNIAGVANVTETSYLSETGPSGRDGIVVGFIINSYFEIISLKIFTGNFNIISYQWNKKNQ